MSIVRVGRRYSIVIPSDVREKLGIREGSKLLLRVEGSKLVLEPLPDDPFKVLEEVLEEPYSEEKDEERALKWLDEHAGH